MFGRLRPDLQFATPFHGDQGGVDLAYGLGYAFLRVGHRGNGRSGVLLDLRLTYFRRLLLVETLGGSLDLPAVHSLPGMDGQADAFGKGGDVRQQPLDTFQFRLAVLRVDGQPVVEAAFLAVLGAEHAVDLVHHVLDVRHSRRERGFGLHQFAHSLAEGYDLLGALRGIDIDGIVDLIVLFLSHGICCSL
ncbi:hypothetical protein [Bacteroides uniformis]|uniref:hypothetical protein n=1 Tax=Bacteroides uniformis TaxID=820 RepID=UPI001E506BE8|nr:hypothetical protein [Bacteroides uniformis]MDC1998205.1 hypothetical protein [Bacteroides uniformis]MDC2001969.1 hypothetical protein [Bacteroides uniformis]MDC2005708.1 hypothetical protein [Bacteroides uniformis]